MITKTLAECEGFIVLRPKITTLNCHSADNLITVLRSKLQDNDGQEIVVDLGYVGSITTLAAKKLSQFFIGTPILIQNIQPTAESSLQWASDYLYEKGELDNYDWYLFV